MIEEATKPQPVYWLADLKRPVALMLAVICPAYLDDAVRRLWPEAKIFRFGSGLIGHRFDRIIMLQTARSASQGSKTAEDFMDGWLEEEMLLKLKPGGDIVWLTAS